MGNDQETIIKLQEENFRQQERIDELEQQLAQRDRLPGESQRLSDDLNLQRADNEDLIDENDHLINEIDELRSEIEMGRQIRLHRFLHAIQEHDKNVSTPGIPICGDMSAFHGFLTSAKRVIEQEGDEALRRLLN